MLTPPPTATKDEIIEEVVSMMKQPEDVFNELMKDATDQFKRD